jgi:hypothetical protein
MRPSFVKKISLEIPARINKMINVNILGTVIMIDKN